MSIKGTSYGSIIGWNMRKVFPKTCSVLYLNLQYLLRRKLTDKYIEYFNKHNPLPFIVSIETINRCNNTCSFCPANINFEKRPLKIMELELFYKIIDDLEAINYDGYISLHINNEPFMDKRIIDLFKYVKRKLKKAKTLMFTNGLLLNIEKFNSIYKYIDVMIINNYSTQYKLHSNLEELYKYIKNNKAKFKNIDVTIQLRYLNEILTNRAGTSPNKKIKEKKIIKEKCLMPYTDLTIYPDGQVGLCCSDTQEITDLGNLKEYSIMDIWNGEKLKDIRSKMNNGRNNLDFCKYCDFVDAGIREKTIKSILNS